MRFIKILKRAFCIDDSSSSDGNNYQALPAHAALSLTYDDYYQKGQEHYSAKQYQDAIISFNAVLHLKENDINSLYYLGCAYFGNKNYEECIATYQKIQKLQPHHDEALNNIGLAYTQTGNFIMARSYYHHALALKYDNQYTNNLIQVNKRLEELNQEVSLLSDLYHSPHCDYQALIKEASLVLEKLAKQSDDPVIKEHFVTTYRYKAIAHYNLGQHDQAFDSFNSSIERCLDDTRRAQLYLEKGKMMEEAGFDPTDHYRLSAAMGNSKSRVLYTRHLQDKTNTPNSFAALLASRSTQPSPVYEPGSDAHGDARSIAPSHFVIQLNLSRSNSARELVLAQ